MFAALHWETASAKLVAVTLGPYFDPLIKEIILFFDFKDQ